MKEKVLATIINSMKKNGFDYSKPLDVLDGIVIDGNIRFKACHVTGITEISVFEHTFKNEEEALDYAIHNQRNRRNISDDGSHLFLIQNIS